MGAGCYYTSDIDKEKTFWIELPEFENEFDFEFWKEELIYNLEHLTKSKKFAAYVFDSDANGFGEIYSNLHRIKLESTYHGDGIVFNFDLVENFDYWGFTNKTEILVLLYILKYSKSLKMPLLIWTTI